MVPVLNKIDLPSAEPDRVIAEIEDIIGIPAHDALRCSAKTGEGMEAALATIESELPRPQVDFDVLLPYERGDLVNRIHQEAEIGSMEHTGDGTLVVGRANADLAGELEAYAR